MKQKNALLELLSISNMLLFLCLSHIYSLPISSSLGVVTLHKSDVMVCGHRSRLKTMMSNSEDFIILFFITFLYYILSCSCTHLYSVY